MSTPEKIRLYCEVHCWLDIPGEHPKAIEWRVCVDGGPLLMVTKNEALARVMAAAPELLEALREMVENLGGHGPITQRARAAIAKATRGGA